MAQQLPRYQEIADELRRQIESGELRRESQLPTENELQKKFGSSRNTVRNAVKLLVTERLLETRGREGTFVTKAHVPFVTTLSTDPKTGLSGIGEEGSTYPTLVLQQDRQAGAEDPEVQVRECPPPIAIRLKIDEKEFVVSRHQQRYIDEVLWSLQTSYYPMKWVEKGATGLLTPKDIGEGAVEYLANSIDLRQSSYRDQLWARQPNDREKELFNLTINHTVIEVYRTSFAEDGTPIRVTVTVYPADRNQVVYDIGDVPGHPGEPIRPGV
ncbi:MAG TPA: GntR family transcriptional regulator [Pseudonocardiaceae bacterium]|nr:GntR family transcriptional regulator [Pseudonocardiaceae bacterium]